MSTTQFFRAGVACHIQVGPDQWTWKPFLGLESTHPLSGSLFITVDCGQALYKTFLDKSAGVLAEVLSQKKWFTFEPSRPHNYEETMKEMQVVADWLGTKV